MKLNEILDFDDLVLACLQIMMYALALAIAGPFSLGFMFLLVPRGHNAAIKHGMESQFTLAVIVAFLLLVLAWYFFLAYTIPYLLGFLVTPSESTGC
jgi:hypothetical protein